MNIPYVQRKLTVYTTEKLSDHLGVPVQINKIGIEWLNRLVLEGVYVEDESGETLLDANHISARFDIIPFMYGKYVFTAIRLFGFNVNLSKEHPGDHMNLQFLLDAFSSKDTLKQALDIDLKLNSVLLRRGNISYNVESESATPGRFNSKHINIADVSANISITAFNKDSLNAQVKRLSFKEHSGFALDRLSMNIVGNSDSAYIDNFEIRLPQSRVKIDKATIGLSEIDGLTTLLNNAPVELSIAPSQIYLRELSPFIPAFSNFNDTVQLSAEATGYINNINLRQFTMRQSDKMLFNGMMELRSITSPQETYVFGQVNKLYITSEGLANIIQNFNEQAIEPPEALLNLGSVNFTGEISGFFDNLVAFGKFTTPVGSIETDMIIGSNKERNIASYISGHISTSNLELDQLFPPSVPIGQTRFDIVLDVTRPVNGSFSGNIQGDIQEFSFRNYTYTDIAISGNFTNKGFDGLLHINDPNGELLAEGIFNNEEHNPVFNFTADVKHFRPDKLYLTDQYESPEIDFSLSANFTGNTIDNVEGNILLDSLSIKTAPNSFFLEELAIAASGYKDDRKLTISSDIINGEVVGAYSFTTILPSIFQTAANYVPSLINTKQKNEQVQENNFSILLTIENTEALSNTLKLPVTIISQSRITGHYNNIYDRFRLEGWLPQFSISGSSFESGRLSFENPNNSMNLAVNATHFNPNGLRNYLNMRMEAKEDKIDLSMGWANNKERLFKVDLSSSTLFVNDVAENGNESSIRTEISINPGELVINDSIWAIEPAAITVQNDKVTVDNLFITHDKQYVHLDGIVSKDPSDTLYLDLEQIELSYIFETLDIPVLQFGGKATGAFNISDLYGSRMLNTDLEVQNFSFNQVNLGRLNLFSEWDDEQRGILMLGSIYKNDSTWTDVSGYIFPVKPNEGLSLYFDANDVDIAFLHPFLKDVAKDIQGRGFGQVHLFGPFSEVTIEGEAYVENAGMGIDFLDTYYTFSDSVKMTPTTISLNDVSVFDKHGNSGKATLAFNHTYFKDYDFTANIQANNMLVYDKSERDNPMIFGSVFGSGAATISGNENIINFDVNLRSDPQTAISFNFMTNSASEEYNFITFVDQHEDLSDSANTDSIVSNGNNQDSSAELRMNFLVDITPDAVIELIMDPTAGDRIKGNATGSLQVQYDNKSDNIRMYGGADIVDGSYNFSLQQIIHRDFKIREGSNVSFQGDPYNANININAIYSLTANLRDLDEDLLMEVSRTSVPVNCVLVLDGMLRNPNIAFDIELPNSNEEIQRRVRSFIDTDEMMARQVVYLLVLSRFYTPDYASNIDRSNEFNAVASSAISQQLSSILNGITDKVQIGTNIRAGQEGFNEDTEVEMLLSSQLLDNRLIINGNLGYRNNALLGQNKNIFVGEFDLEYKLTPSGDIRLKAYNHANDMYQYLKQSLTTQGVGIMFKKDFTRFSDLFGRRRERTPITPETEP